jgi:hypothetical protein
VLRSPQFLVAEAHLLQKDLLAGIPPKTKALKWRENAPTYYLLLSTRVGYFRNKALPKLAVLILAGRSSDLLHTNHTFPKFLHISGLS